jgi:hypothetical protein
MQLAYSALRKSASVSPSRKICCPPLASIESPRNSGDDLDRNQFFGVQARIPFFQLVPVNGDER